MISGLKQVPNKKTPGLVRSVRSATLTVTELLRAPRLGYLPWRAERVPGDDYGLYAERGTVGLCYDFRGPFSPLRKKKKKLNILVFTAYNEYDPAPIIYTFPPMWSRYASCLLQEVKYFCVMAAGTVLTVPNRENGPP